MKEINPTILWISLEFRLPKGYTHLKLLCMKLNQIAFLDDNSDLRELFSEYFELALDAKVITLSSYDELVKNMPKILQSDLVILDIELGFNQPSGYDAYKTLIQNGYKGMIFFLTGHGADHPLVQKAKASNCIVWEKPITGENMAEQIKAHMDKFQPSGQK